MDRLSLRGWRLALVAVTLGSCSSEVASSVAASRRPESIVAVSCGMFPAFGVGDRLQLDKNVADLERGDIVSHRLSGPGGEPQLYVHRVVGLPGERLEAAEDGGLLVNGAPLVEEYLPAGTTTRFGEPVDVPADHYFVLGDNRERSSDSRVLGPLPRAAIAARVTKVVPVKNDEDPCR